ncbi:MAG: tetratricopeptide repeat protein [Myxococcaceae bacterium]
MSTQRANQLVEAGLWLRLSGDHEGARRLFEQALKLDPTNLRAKQLSQAAFTGSPVPPPTEPKKERANPFMRQERTESTRVGDFGYPGYWDKAAKPQDDPTDAPTLPGQPGRGPAPPPQPGAPLLTAAPVAPVLSDAKTAWDSKSNPGKEVPTVGPGIGGAMDMLVEEDSLPPSVVVEAPPPTKSVREEVRLLLRRAKDLLDLDDHSGAVGLIVKAQELAPDDPGVKEMREHSERVLQAMFESKLGDLGARPRVALKEDEIIWLNLDHRAGFVLAQIDGTVSFEDLFAVSGMSRVDTARILAQLVDEGVIKR